MSKSKAKELSANPTGKAPKCNCWYCDPRPDRVPAWKVWAFALANPGVDVFRH